jgi:hypothetical protein
MINQSFDDYLKGKKINPDSFKSAQVDEYQRLKQVFDELSPESFTAQKLFLINRIRRAHPFAGPDSKPGLNKP